MIRTKPGRRCRALLLAAAATALAACGGRGLPESAGASLPATTPPSAKSSAKIQHVIIVIQENRSFDNFFATFPGADGTKTGKMEIVKNGKRVGSKTIALHEVNLLEGTDLDHTHAGFETAYDGGRMDGFNLTHLGAAGTGPPSGTFTYQYVNPAQIQPYWDLAKQYVLVDHMFQTQGSGSFTAHQDLIAGGTEISAKAAERLGLGDAAALIDNPTWFPWGCDAPKKVLVPTITPDGVVHPYIGPFPCMGYATLRDVLDAKQVSWKFYTMKVYKKYPQSNGPGIWSAFDVIRAVRYGAEWNTNVTDTDLKLFSDISAHHLPAVSWVTPDAVNSDHPAERSDTGPSWVTQIVNSVGQSSYWNSTAIIVVWDDWGGFFDHVKPPFQDQQGGLGFRVPMLIVSPYVKPHIDHTQYEFGSILRFIEDNWDLGRLGSTDTRATSIANAFDFNMKPRKFSPVPAKYSKSFFLHQKPSGLPVDTE